MMQTRGARGPDIHRRSFSNRLEPFENLDLVRTVVRQVRFRDDRRLGYNRYFSLASRLRRLVDGRLLIQLRHMYIVYFL